MKVELLTREDSDCLEHHRVKVDGKDIASIGPLSECPEDAIIGRDLIDGGDVVRYIKMGYDAGIRNEEFEVVEGKLED